MTSSPAARRSSPSPLRRRLLPGLLGLVSAALLTASTVVVTASPATASPAAAAGATAGNSTGNSTGTATTRTVDRPGRQAAPRKDRSGRGAPYARLHRPSPALQEPADQLAASLRCNGRLAGEHVGDPILLVPGTFTTPEQNFTFNYLRAFDRAGRAWCTVDIPNATTGDAQAGGERIVHALRTMHQVSGSRIDVLGYSQGGLLPRFAFRFFPDTRRLVDDFVALAPTNHGTILAGVACLVPLCQPGVLQQQRRSAFVTAVNSGQETFDKVDYTVVYTRTDEVATPNLTNRGTSALPRDSRADVVNVAIQDICPLDLNEHTLLGTVDPVGYALALDAFDHPGVAVPARIDRGVCLQGLHPGVDPLTFPVDYAGYLADFAQNFAVQPRVVREPALRSYVLR